MPFSKCVFHEKPRWEGRAFLQSRNQPILSLRKEYQIPTRLHAPPHTSIAIIFVKKGKYKNNSKYEQ